MDKFKEQLNKCIQAIERIANMINLQHIQSDNINYNELYNALYQLIPLYHKNIIFLEYDRNQPHRI